MSTRSARAAWLAGCTRPTQPQGATQANDKHEPDEEARRSPRRSEEEK